MLGLKLNYVSKEGPIVLGSLYLSYPATCTEIDIGRQQLNLLHYILNVFTTLCLQ